MRPALRRSLLARVLLLWALALPAWAPGARAQDGPPGEAAPRGAAARGAAAREAAERVHEAGHYPSDVVPLIPGRDQATGSGDEAMGGAGRGPRGETVLGDRASGERGTGDSGPLGGAIRQILEWLGGITRFLGGPLAYVILAIGLALLAMFVAYLVARVRLGSASAAVEARSTSGEGAIDPMLVGPSLSAEELAAQRRWGEAIHALFLEVLGRVGGQEGRLRGRTARELVVRARRAELDDLLDLTELVWFGGRPATEDQYRRARELATSVPQRAPADRTDHDPSDRDEAA